MDAAQQYDRIVRVLSAMLYAYDPSGMGSSVFAPEDEYDDPARRLVAAATDAIDFASLVRTHYPAATDQLVDALVAALLLYLDVGESPGGAKSDG
jgi:hypothetical protein